MARPLRLEFPGAVYHLTSRGNTRQKIFFTDADRELFFLRRRISLWATRPLTMAAHALKGAKTGGSAQRSQLFKRIKDFQPGPPKVVVIASDDGEIITASGSCNIAVFNRHATARPLQLPLLFGPNMGD